MDKMMVLVLGNYILGTIVLVAHQSLAMLYRFLEASASLSFLGFSAKRLAYGVAHGSVGLVFFLYVLLLLFFYKKSTLRIQFPGDVFLKNILYILVFPLVLSSMFFVCLIIYFGVDVFNVQVLQDYLSVYIKNPTVFWFLGLFPVWVLLHGFLTLLLSCELSLRFKTESL